MKIARLTVGRPIATIMVTLIAVTVGMIALGRLPIDLMPDITYPTLTVATDYENASPEEIEQLVTRLVEEAVAAVPGVEEMTSVSSEGRSNVRVSFAWGTDLDVASNDIRDRLERILDNLPEESERPQLRKFDVASFPILILGVSSDLDPVELRQVIDEQMSYRIERVPGVAAVDIWGGLEREIHVNLHHEKIKALGLSLDRIREAIREANLTVPAGEIERGNFDVTLRTPGEFTSLAQIRGTVVAIREGAPVYLRQIADVEDTHAKVTRIVRINGKPGVRIAIRKQSGSNTVEVARAAHREVERLREDFPQVDIIPVIDTSLYIQRSIDNVAQSILYGGTLAVLVLLFFLRSLRTTFVIATAIPISIVTTLALIYFGGFTLNLMTLGGLALGVGMMVDNAIVVLENIARLREQKRYGASEAAVSGTEQVSAAIIASTVTTLVIFLPMAFAEEITGVMFRQFAYIVSFSLLCSLAVSLTLVPMLASRLMQRPASRAAAGNISKTRLLAGSDRAFGTLERLYGGMLDAALRQRLLSLVVVLALLGATLALIPLIGGEFMPATDEGEVRVSAEMEPGTRLAVLDARLRQIEAIVDESVPEAVASVVRVGGSSYRGSSASGEIRVSLPPAAQRDRSSEEIAAALRRKLVGIPGVVVRARAGQGLFLLRLGAADAENLEIDIRGFEIATLDRLARAVRDSIADIPGITDARLSRESGVPQQLFRIDRDRAADLGLSVTQVARMLETAIAGSTAGQYREGGDEFRILVKLKDAERLDLEQVLDLTMLNEQGEQIVLRNLVIAETNRGPLQIERKDQQRIVSIAANVSGRDLTSVVDEVRERLKSIPVPRNYDIVISGDYEEQQEAFRELLLNFVLAIALVYMVMACLYESLIDPLIVMVSVPLGAIGVILTLLLTGTTFNVQSFIGCVMLVGIVVNNAILIVDQAGQLRRSEGLAVREAVRAAGRQRLRPILMTSLTTILALVPLALGFGEGAEAQAPLARVVIGGLTSSMLITLVVIPVIYTLVHRERPLGDSASKRAAGSA